jgi:hypothetical protein
MDNQTKRTLVGLGAMLVGAILVVSGLLQIPVVPVVLILVGGVLGFIGYKIFENRGNTKPDDLVYG